MAVEWVAFLFHIRETLVSKLGSQTGYPDRGFSWFFAVPLMQIRLMTASFHSLSLITQSFDATYSGLLTAS
jgi:hypothetical protein